jgi:hypothetical protein
LLEIGCTVKFKDNLWPEKKVDGMLKGSSFREALPADAENEFKVSNILFTGEEDSIILLENFPEPVCENELEVL